MWQANFDTVDLITGFEQLRTQAYQDSAGIWTIGYGTTRINNRPILRGMVINNIVANSLILSSLDGVIDSLNTFIGFNIKLNQNQVNALCSLIYNIGERNFVSSTLLKSINKGLLITENMFTDWNKARVNGKLVVLDGLTTRRKKEFQIFNSGV